MNTWEKKYGPDPNLGDLPKIKIPEFTYKIGVDPKEGNGYYRVYADGRIFWAGKT